MVNFTNQNKSFNEFVSEVLLSVTSRDSVTYDDVVITEVVVADDERARGYIVTGKYTHEFLYFVDVDCDMMKMLTYDVKINDTKEIKNIDNLQEWVKYNELDLIEVSQAYILENQQTQNSTESKPRFWGWTREEDLHWSECFPDGKQIAPRVYWVLWMDTGIHDIVSRPCDYIPLN